MLSLKEQISLKGCLRCLDFGQFATACTDKHTIGRTDARGVENRAISSKIALHIVQRERERE